MSRACLKAGEARARQIEYEANKMRNSMLSLQAAHGVQVGQGSLLETEIQFEEEVEYSKQLARYPHEQAGHAANYASTLFGFQSKRAGTAAYTNAGVAGGSTLATAVARDPQLYSDAYYKLKGGSSA